MRNLIVVLALAAAACGGSSKPAATTPTGGGEEPVDDDSGGGEMVPPERMDEITALLQRKRTAAARCLADAVNTGKANKNARGHVAVSWTISTSGQAQGARVTETSLDNETVEACVIRKIEEIDFGPLPRELEWSHAFAFESM